jgi:uncharacterized protein involved in copper resistance
VVFDQFEGRTNGDVTGFRWDSGGWVGTVSNKLRLKTEALVDERDVARDGDQELPYERPIAFVRYFDWQAGVRYDWDSGGHVRASGVRAPRGTLTLIVTRRASSSSPAPARAA